MKTIFSTISLLLISKVIFACMFEFVGLCGYLEWYNPDFIMSGTILSIDEHKAEIKVIDQFSGSDDRDIIMVHGGEDYVLDGGTMCARSISMDINDIGIAGDTIVICLYKISEKKYEEDIIGNYRMPGKFATTPWIKISGGKLKICYEKCTPDLEDTEILYDDFINLWDNGKLDCISESFCDTVTLDLGDDFTLNYGETKELNAGKYVHWSTGLFRQTEEITCSNSGTIVDTIWARYTYPSFLKRGEIPVCDIRDTVLVTMQGLLPTEPCDATEVNLGENIVLAYEESVTLNAQSIVEWNNGIKASEIILTNSEGIFLIDTVWARSTGSGLEEGEYFECESRDTLIVTFLAKPEPIVDCDTVILNLGEDQTVAYKEAITLTVLHNVTWSDGSIGKELILTNSAESIRIDTIWAQRIEQNCAIYDSIFVTFLGKPVPQIDCDTVTLDLGEDQTVDYRESVTLSVPYEVTWSDGSTGTELIVANNSVIAGKETIWAFRRELDCSVYDTVLVTFTLPSSVNTKSMIDVSLKGKTLTVRSIESKSNYSLELLTIEGVLVDKVTFDNELIYSIPNISEQMVIIQLKQNDNVVSSQLIKL